MCFDLIRVCLYASWAKGNDRNKGRPGNEVVRSSGCAPCHRKCLITATLVCFWSSHTPLSSEAEWAAFRLPRLSSSRSIWCPGFCVGTLSQLRLVLFPYRDNDIIKHSRLSNRSCVCAFLEKFKHINNNYIKKFKQYLYYPHSALSMKIWLLVRSR